MALPGQAPPAPPSSPPSSSLPNPTPFVGEPLDKAGAYGIQAAGGLFVKHLEGDYYAVVGLPLHALAQSLVAAMGDV